MTDRDPRARILELEDTVGRLHRERDRAIAAVRDCRGWFQFIVDTDSYLATREACTRALADTAEWRL